MDERTSRQEAYNALVAKRKTCRVCAQDLANPACLKGDGSDSGLVNPACFEDGIYDSDHIGPWSCWQGNLNSKVLVVGQDWGDRAYFKKWQGLDQPSGNPTNTNLQALLKQFGISIQDPRESQEQLIFLSNIILCLKDGGMQAPIKDEWLSSCAVDFFCPLVKIIKPKIIIALGERLSKKILTLYGIPHPKSAPLSQLMNGSPFKLTGSTYLFPVYHCGAGGVNRNRSMEKQEEDWAKAADWFRASYVDGEA